MKNCPFCKENFFPYHKQLGLDPLKAILFSDENVYVTPDISPISEGHYLIITHRHCVNFAQGDDAIKKSLHNAIRFVREKIYFCENFLAFEHGATDTESSGNSINHAHLHIIPGDRTISEMVISERLYENYYRLSLEQFSEAYPDKPYMWIMEGESQSKFFISKNPPSQYLRKVYVNKYPFLYTYNWRMEHKSSESVSQYLLNLSKAPSSIALNDTKKRIREKHGCFERYTEQDFDTAVINHIMSSPYETIDRSELNQLYSDYREEGLFFLSERAMHPLFLTDENNHETYKEWIIRRFKAEVSQLKLFPDLFHAIDLYGDDLYTDAYNILQFKDKSGLFFDQVISNQIYSDIFRRIIIFLLTGDALRVYHSHKSFNEVGKRISLMLLKLTEKLSIYQVIHYSTIAGLVGMNIKESIVSTSPCSLKTCFDVSYDCSNEDIEILHNEILNRMISTINMDIDDRYSFCQEVLLSNNKTLTIITDDYIEGVLEMKLAEKLLSENPTLTINFHPRCNQYSNDLSCFDVIELLKEKTFSLLSLYYQNGRFKLCLQGMDISTFVPSRLSFSAFDDILNSDYLYIVGARAFEMAQGINKLTYYSGIAVCKSYTETITGFSKNSGALVFMRCAPGEYAFAGFKERAQRTIKYNEEIIRVAKETARERADKQH